MNRQNQLITIYLYVCKHYQDHLCVYSQRMSNYADRHLREWFPRLPSYTVYVQRLNIVANVFAPLLEIIQQEQASKNHENVWLIDSFPVALAK